jgi:hypothetical protein
MTAHGEESEQVGRETRQSAHPCGALSYPPPPSSFHRYLDGCTCANYICKKMRGRGGRVEKGKNKTTKTEDEFEM